MTGSDAFRETRGAKKGTIEWAAFWEGQNLYSKYSCKINLKAMKWTLN